MVRLFAKCKTVISAIINQDYLFSIVSKFLGVFIALVYSVFFNRYLGATLKGQAAIISNYASLISSIVCLGMYQAYPFYRNKNKNEFYCFVNNITSLYVVIFISSVLFSTFAQQVDINLRIAVVMMPVLAYIRHINYVVTIENPKKRNITSIILNVMDLLVVIVLWLFTTANFKYLCVILALQTLINLILSFANLKVIWSKMRFTLTSIPRYAKFGFLPMITLFLMTINYRIDILMLEMDTGISLSQIGIYSVGVALAEKVWLIPDAVKDILLSKLCKGKDASEVCVVTRINVAVSVVMILFVALISKPMVDWVYGEEYVGSDIITIIILVGTIGMVFYKMIYSYNISRGKRLVNLVFLAIAAIVNVIGNYYFIPLFGIYGAAITSVVSYTICGLCFLVYFRYSADVPYSQVLFLQKKDFYAIKNFLKFKKQ